MTFKVVLLESAEHDLNELKAYLVRAFSAHVWSSTSRQIKHTLGTLRHFPFSGDALDLLTEPMFADFRQILSGMNRIIYEVRGGTVFIHAILDTRRNYVDLLRRRGHAGSGPGGI